MSGPAEVVASMDLASLAFVGGTMFVAAIWSLLPFSLFGVRGRLDAIEESKRVQTEALVRELRQIHAGLARAGERR